MPYVIKGNCVYKKNGTLVGCSDNVQSYVKTLRAVEHGFKPNAKSKKTKKRSKK